MLKSQKTAPPKPGAKVQKIIDLRQQVIVATPIFPYFICASESQGTLTKDVGSD